MKFWFFMVLVFGGVALAAETDKEDPFQKIKDAGVVVTYVAALTVGIVALIRNHLSQEIRGKWVVVMSVVIGGLVGAALYFLGYFPSFENRWYEVVGLGLVGGISASGTVDAVRTAWRQK
jgi:drug/metabolite transporter (DMT)-like permease